MWQCLSQGHYCKHGSMHQGLHDSDSIIPPSSGNGGTPHSNVPYMSLIRMQKSSPFDFGLNRPSSQHSGGARSGSLEAGRNSSRVSPQPSFLLST